MKSFKPGDPVYAFREGCGLGLAFRGIVLNIHGSAGEKGKSGHNNKAVVLDTSVSGEPRIIEVTECHPDRGMSRAEAREILAAYGYEDDCSEEPEEEAARLTTLWQPRPF